MSDEADLLKENGVASVQYAIELFNQPREGGRQHGVLMFLNHGLELLLKAGITNHGGTIWEGGDGNTIGFEKSVNKAIHGEYDVADVGFLDEDDADPLRIINGLRDEAVHYVIDIGENQFYVHARTGVTMADKILEEAFDERLADYLPERVLPLSTQPPQEMETLIDSEYRQVKDLLDAGSKGRAGARIRSLAAIERALNEEVDSPTKADVDDLLSDVEEGRDWTDVFPGVASLNLTADGEGPAFRVKLTSSEGEPVRVISEEEAQGDEPVIAERTVNMLDKYSLGVKQLADKLPITWVKVWAVIRELDLHGDERYHKEVRISNSQTQDRYTPATIGRIEEALDNNDVDPELAYAKHWGS